MRRRTGLGRAADAFSVLVYVFLLAPLVVVVLASFITPQTGSFSSPSRLVTG